MSECCVPCCDSKLGACGITFYEFPKEKVRREKWITNIFHKEEETKDGWKPKKHSKVCSKHFEESCFSTSTLKRILLPFSVPTLFQNYSPYTQVYSYDGSIVPKRLSMKRKVSVVETTKQYNKKTRSEEESDYEDMKVSEREMSEPDSTDHILSENGTLPDKKAYTDEGTSCKETEVITLYPKKYYIIEEQDDYHHYQDITKDVKVIIPQPDSTYQTAEECIKENAGTSKTIDKNIQTSFTKINSKYLVQRIRKLENENAVLFAKVKTLQDRLKQVEKELK